MAEPLIILPGLMCDSRMFASQLAAFTNIRVIDGFYGCADRIEAMAEPRLSGRSSTTRIP